ncbi:MAG: PQQ-like beta-propeller repeat protein, partial [Myxococcales bacterium]|nr:PQQ-like beta-propeller repeat protein [Myxococcales bacterium]
DLDGDGDAELVMVSWDAAREVVAVDGRALRRTLWRRTLSTGAWATPLIIRPSAAAEPIVLLTLLDGTLVALRGRDGAPAWSVALAQRMVHAPAVADLDGDGVLELALTHDDGVECRSAADGALRWAIPGLGTSRSAPAIVDIDGDGALEIIAGSRARGLVALDRDGAPRWERSFTGPDGDALEIGSPLTVADLESDGAPELLLGLRDGTVHALSALDGASCWWFRTTPDQLIEAAPTAADVDGDGVLEVIVGGHDRHLYCLRHRAAGR